MPKWAVVPVIVVPTLIIVIATGIILISAQPKDGATALRQSAPVSQPVAAIGPAINLSGATQSPEVPLGASDETSKEIARLRSENEQLRAINQRLSAQNPRAPNAVPLQHVNGPLLLGSAWLTREDGTSDVLRGLHVQLLPPTIPSSVIQKCIEQDATDWDQPLSGYISKDNIDWFKNDGQQVGEDIIQFMSSSDLFQIKLLRGESERAAAARKSVNFGQSISTKDAFVYAAGLYTAKREAVQSAISQGDILAIRLKGLNYHYAAQLQSIDNEHRFKLATDLRTQNRIETQNLAVVDVATDADGKYAFEGVNDGDYCLPAELNLASAFAEWAIPVKIGAVLPLKINLSNENATVLYRRTQP